MSLAACGDSTGDNIAAGAAASAAASGLAGPAAALQVAGPGVDAARPAPQAKEAAAPPALPYAFVGKWSAAGRTTVYLKRDEQTVVVQAAGPLDAQYAVHSLDAQQLVLLYLPLGTLHRIDLEAVPRAAMAPGPGTAFPALPGPQKSATASSSSDDPQPDN